MVTGESEAGGRRRKAGFRECNRGMCMYSQLTSSIFLDLAPKIVFPILTFGGHNNNDDGPIGRSDAKKGSEVRWLRTYDFQHFTL